MYKYIFAIVLALLSFNSFAQIKAEEVTLTDFIKDIIITKKDGDNMKQIWILPKEYWDVALSDSSYTNEETTDEINKLLKDYLIIAALDVEIAPFTGIRSNKITIALEDNNTTFHKPIDFDDLDEDVRSIINVLKPTMERMMGQLGEQLEFYVFNNVKENDEDLLTPFKNGAVTIHLNETTFKFKTPFSSLVKKKICPVDDEALNGNWIYCPWHSKKLKY